MSASYAQESVVEEYLDDFEEDASQPNLSVSRSRGQIGTTSVKRSMHIQDDVISEYGQEEFESMNSSQN